MYVLNFLVTFLLLTTNTALHIRVYCAALVATTHECTTYATCLWYMCVAFLTGFVCHKFRAYIYTRPKRNEYEKRGQRIIVEAISG